MAYQKDTPYSPTLQERSNREATKTPGSGPTGSEIVQLIGKLQDLRGFRDQHWEGGFEDYLQIVRHNPKVTRTAFQRIYDMILSKGTREYFEYKKKIVHYNFFDDKDHGGMDAVFGLDIPLMKLVTDRSGRPSRRSSASSRRGSRTTPRRPRARSTPSSGSSTARRDVGAPTRRPSSCPARCTRSRCIWFPRTCGPRS